MSDKIKVFIADDHRMVREGIVSILEEFDEILVYGQAENGSDALEKIEGLPSLPEVVLLDINMPIMDGIECTKELFKIYKDKIRVIALTMMKQSMHIRKMLQAGASGYLLKDCDKTELLGAIKTIASGNTYFSNSVSLEVMNEMTRIEKADKKAVDMPLSNREKEVLELIIKEMSNNDIAKKLNISVRTVESHAQNLLAKSGANNVAGLVVYAIKNKLIDL